MGLREYKRKRKFDVTPEPAGSPKAASSGNLYVIQKHDASRLHYDFRLELDGVLKSWAVPKGPNLDPRQRCLAVEVEDHPLEYGSFEGTIPEGQYGGGTVLLWDRGTWKAIGDARKDYQSGRLKFELHGEKLRGIWNLVRMRPRDSRKPASGNKSEWLLIKHGDQYSRPAAEYDILTAEPRSVLTGRDLDEIAESSGDVWESGRKSRLRKRSPKAAASSKPPTVQTRAQAPDLAAISRLTNAARAKLPGFVSPQLALMVKTPPDGPEWLHEIKFDGYRFIAILREGAARLLTRRTNDWTSKFPEIRSALESLPVRNAILDGEVVALNREGVSDFQALQNTMKLGRSKLLYYLFDILYCDGFDLTRTPLIERKTLLAGLLAGARDPLRFSDHVIGHGPAMLEKSCRLKLEGIVSKRADSAYQSRRSGDWLKAKCLNEQEFVIGGFTDPEGARTGFGALVLGYYEPDGSLRYCGKVGTGFDEPTLRDLHRRLISLETKTPPFAIAPPRGQVGRAHWVRPELVAQVRYAHFTTDGIVRHSAFLGLREDKPPKSVVREQPVDIGGDGQAAAAKPSASRATPRAPRTVAPGDGEIAGVKLTNPDRVLFPDIGLIKADLALYYEAVAESMLPHVTQRPLMIARCPEGQTGKCFYQKHMNASVPKQVKSIRIREKNKERPYLVVDDVPGLVSLAQMSALEIHTWASRTAQLEQPDQMIFDLDPAPDVAWAALIEAATKIRDLLREAGLECFVKLSGGKGLHLVTPLEPADSWDELGEFSAGVATALATAQPERYVATMSKAKRTGRIFIDYLRNQRGASCVAAYSPRRKPGAPVSLPIAWHDVQKSTQMPVYCVEDHAQWLPQATKAWAGFEAGRRPLPRHLLAPRPRGGGRPVRRG